MKQSRRKHSTMRKKNTRMSRKRHTQKRKTKKQQSKKRQKKINQRNYVNKNYKGGRITKVPALLTYDVGSPHKVAFERIQQQNEHQNAINNGTSIMKGGNQELQTVPQIHTGMAASPIDANNQAVGSASSLLQTSENSKYDSCLTNPNCMNNQNGGRVNKIYVKKRNGKRKHKKTNKNKKYTKNHYKR